MIVTLTLNPSMDKTLILAELAVGETNRVKVSLSDPGGKGINVSRVMRELGQESLAMGFVSGAVGRFVEHALNERGIFDDFIHTPGQTRTNVVIVEVERDKTTNLNEAGPETDPRHLAELKVRLRSHLSLGSWLVIAGSIPPGIPTGIYADLIDLAARLGVHTALDGDGEPLTLGVAAQPALIKPNWRELERILGRAVAGEADVFAAARHLHQSGIRYVVVSMGGLGSIAVTAEGMWKAVPPAVDSVSATGAGDSLVAGVVLALNQGKPFVEGLRLGTAAGAATTLRLGTQLCRREDVERLLPLVQIETLGDDAYASKRGAGLGEDHRA